MTNIIILASKANKVAKVTVLSPFVDMTRMSQLPTHHAIGWMSPQEQATYVGAEDEDILLPHF